MNIKEKLAVIQQELHAPKSEPNTFGGYKYRTVSKILKNLKPLLKEYNALLTMSDEVVEVGGRIYVKATAVLEDLEGEGGIGVSAYAREQLERKKSDDSQLTGAASTYARKYALGALFLIDDEEEEDPDSYEDFDDPDEELDKQEEEEKPVERKPRTRRKKKDEDFMNIPEGVDEEVPFLTEEELDEHIGKVFGGPYDPETGLPTMEDDEDDGKVKEDDAFFHIPGEGLGNYVKLHKGDEIPEGAEAITEKEWQEGCTAIAQKKEPEKKPMTRRTRRKRA